MERRKEKLALTQLKTKQLLNEQELKRRITELQYEREFMEAHLLHTELNYAIYMKSLTGVMKGEVLWRSLFPLIAHLC